MNSQQSQQSQQWLVQAFAQLDDGIKLLRSAQVGNEQEARSLAGLFLSELHEEGYPVERLLANMYKRRPEA